MSEEQRYTPGPWHWDSDPIKGDPLGRVRYRVTAKGKTITQCYYAGDDPHAEYDARLIASAPTLRDERDRLARAIVWALGYTDFRAREPGEGPYWWRIELRLRAKLTGEQIDAILAALTRFSPP